MQRSTHLFISLSLYLCLYRTHHFLLFLLFLSISSSVQAFEQEGTIYVSGDHSYPPYEFINEDGKPDGYNTELTRAIAEVMGMDIEIQLGDWDLMRSNSQSSAQIF